MHMERQRNEQLQQMPAAFDPLQETKHRRSMKSGVAQSKNWELMFKFSSLVSN